MNTINTTRMTMKRILSVFFIQAIFLSSILTSAFAQSLQKLVRIDLSEKSIYEVKSFLEIHPDILGYNAKVGATEVILNERQIARLASLGYEMTTVIDDLETYDSNLRAQGYFDRFHNYEQTLTEMQEAVQNYPDLAMLIDIGDGWEKNAGLSDRDVWAIKISDNVTVEEADEPEVLIIGCHHAREIITPEIVLYYMNYLLDNYSIDPYIKYLVDNRQIWLIPLLNPDGHEYVIYVYSMWRKNTRDNDENDYFDPSYDGVDLNRNYGYQWGYDNIGSSPNPASNTYRGTEAFSEPETQAIRELCKSHNFKISLSYHSYMQAILFPWGYTQADTPDHDTFVALADSCVAYNGYERGNWNMGVVYSTNGDSDDWLYGEQTEKNKIFGFTPEVGTAFLPDTSRIKSEILENLGPNIYMTYAVGEEPIITHTPSAFIPEFNGPYEISATITPGIPLTTNTAINIDENTVYCYYTTTGTTPYDSLQMQRGQNQDEWIATIPGVGSTQTIAYYISATDTLGRTGFSPRGASLAKHTFEIIDTTSNGGDEIPTHFRISRNYPNPFNARTVIEIDLDTPSKVEAIIYNVLGQKINTLLSSNLDAQYYSLTWDGLDEFGAQVPSGCFFLRLSINKSTHIIKMLKIL